MLSLTSFLSLAFIMIAISNCAEDQAESPTKKQCTYTQTQKRFLKELETFNHRTIFKLNNGVPDGRIKFFDRDQLDRLALQIGDFKCHSKRLLKAGKELNRIDHTFYEIGYRKSEYLIKSHEVKKVEGRYETLQMISAELGASINDLIKYNPNDIDAAKRSVIIKDENALPTIVHYQKI